MDKKKKKQVNAESTDQYMRLYKAGYDKKTRDTDRRLRADLKTPDPREASDSDLARYDAAVSKQAKADKLKKDKAKKKKALDKIISRKK